MMLDLLEHRSARTGTLAEDDGARRIEDLDRLTRIVVEAEDIATLRRAVLGVIGVIREDYGR